MNAIKMQWMQFYIWKLHIFNKHMKRHLHLALGRRRIYLFRQTGFWIQHLKKSKLWTHEVVQPYIKQTEHNKTKSNKAHTGQKSTWGHNRGQNKNHAERAKFRGQKMRANNEGKKQGKGKTTNYYLPILYLLIGSWKGLPIEYFDFNLDSNPILFNSKVFIWGAVRVLFWSWLRNRMLS